MYHTPPLVTICKLQKPGKFKTHFFGTSEVRRGNCLAEDDSQVYLHICLTYGPYQFPFTSVPYATAAENTWPSKWPWPWRRTPQHARLIVCLTLESKALQESSRAISLSNTTNIKTCPVRCFHSTKGDTDYNTCVTLEWNEMLSYYIWIAFFSENLFAQNSALLQASLYVGQDRTTGRLLDL